VRENAAAYGHYGTADDDPEEAADFWHWIFLMEIIQPNSFEFVPY
jgi:hypothetical protein